MSVANKINEKLSHNFNQLCLTVDALVDVSVGYSIKVQLLLA